MSDFGGNIIKYFHPSFREWHVRRENTLAKLFQGHSQTRRRPIRARIHKYTPPPKPLVNTIFTLKRNLSSALPRLRVSHPQDACTGSAETLHHRADQTASLDAGGGAGAHRGGEHVRRHRIGGAERADPEADDDARYRCAEDARELEGNHERFISPA